MLMSWILIAVTALAGAVPEAREFTLAPTNGGLYCSFALQPSAASYIRCKMFLPNDWDGRLWGFGNGGWAGTVSMQRQGRSATIMNDLGTSRRPRLVIGEDPEVLTDYAWRATHVSTLAAKQIVKAHYGRLPDHSYFFGASCGGRQGLTEAVRFPEDYDGIISEVPGLTEHSRIGHAWQREGLKRKYGKWFTPEERRLVRQAELAYFAATDPDWARGKFILDPYPTPAKLDGCWREIVKVAPQLKDRETYWRELFEPVRVNGKRVAAGRLLGIEFDCAWSFLPRKYFNIDRPDQMTEELFVKFLTMSNDWSVGGHDLSSFKARGGKLIMLGGLEDLSCAEPEIREFYETVADKMGGFQAVRPFFAYYVEPGRTHGAAGEPSGNGRVGAPCGLKEKIVAWVERGVDPGTVEFKWNHEPRRLRVAPYPDLRVDCVDEK